MGNSCRKQSRTGSHQNLPSLDKLDGVKNSNPKKAKRNKYVGPPTKPGGGQYDEITIPIPVIARHKFKNKNQLEGEFLIVERGENLLLIYEAGPDWCYVKRDSGNGAEEGFVPTYVVHGSNKKSAEQVNTASPKIPNTSADDDGIYDNDPMRPVSQDAGSLYENIPRVIAEEDSEDEYVVPDVRSNGDEVQLIEDINSDEDEDCGEYVEPGVINKAYSGTESESHTEVQATTNHTTTTENCLSYSKGDIMVIEQEATPEGWLFVRMKTSGQTGYVLNRNVGPPAPATVPETTPAPPAPATVPETTPTPTQQPSAGSVSQKTPELKSQTSSGVAALGTCAEPEVESVIDEAAVKNPKVNGGGALPSSSFTKGTKVKAVFDFLTDEVVNLSFKKGDVLEIADDTDLDSNWYDAKHPGTGSTGLVPRNFVTRCHDATNKGTTMIAPVTVHSTADPIAAEETEGIPQVDTALSTEQLQPTKAPTESDKAKDSDEKIDVDKAPPSVSSKNVDKAPPSVSSKYVDKAPSSVSSKNVDKAPPSVSSKNVDKAPPSVSSKNVDSNSNRPASSGGVQNMMSIFQNNDVKPSIKQEKPPLVQPKIKFTPTAIATKVEPTTAVQPSAESSHSSTSSAGQPKTATALKDYTTAISDFLSVVKGDVVEILDEQGLKYMGKCQRTGKVGLINTKLLSRPNLPSVSDDKSFSWFRSKLPRKEATAYLRSLGDVFGSFLVRESENNPGNYTLCMIGPGKTPSETSSIRQHVIHCSAEGEYFISDNRKFNSLGALVAAYQTEDLGLSCRLAADP